MRTARDRGKESGGLMVATIQLAITLGASVGGVLFDLKGHQGTFVVSCRSARSRRAGGQGRQSLRRGVGSDIPSSDRRPVRRTTRRVVAVWTPYQEIRQCTKENEPFSREMRSIDGSHCSVRRT